MAAAINIATNRKLRQTDLTHRSALTSAALKKPLRHTWMQSLQIEHRQKIDREFKTIAGSLQIFAPIVRYARNNFGALTSSTVAFAAVNAYAEVATVRNSGSTMHSRRVSYTA